MYGSEEETSFRQRAWARCMYFEYTNIKGVKKSDVIQKIGSENRDKYCFTELGTLVRCLVGDRRCL